jgi:hypothetical protein
MQIQNDVSHSGHITDYSRQHKWLPVNTIEGDDPFTKAADCRDIRDELIVGHVWHVLPFRVNDSWRSVLGWHDCIDIDVLMAQLVGSIAASDVPAVGATLSYLHQNHSMEN